MKTIGVLGGLGPQATTDFEVRLHRAAQRLIPPHENSGYPPLIVYYYRHPPIVLDDEQRPVLPYQVAPDLLQAARWLATRADFLVITANAPHLVQDQLEQAGCPILSMIEVTLAEVQSRGWRTIGVLGFMDPQVPVYTEPLSQLKLGFEVIGGDLQTRLNAAITALMEGRETSESAQTAREAVATLRARSVDGIILGCTEIPLLLHEDAGAPDLINPAQLLAEAAVRHALA